MSNSEGMDPQQHQIPRSLGPLVAQNISFFPAPPLILHTHSVDRARHLFALSREREVDTGPWPTTSWKQISTIKTSLLSHYPLWTPSSQSRLPVSSVLSSTVHSFCCNLVGTRFFWLFWNSVCRSDWAFTHKDHPASASWVSGWKARTTMSGVLLFFYSLDS